MELGVYYRTATIYWIWTGLKAQHLILILLVMTPSSSFNIDTGKIWSFTANQKSLFGQNVMQYKHASSKGVYVTSPLKDFEKRATDGLYKCSLTSQNLHCELDTIIPESGQAWQVIRAVPYPSVSQARNSDSILTCQQVKARKKKSTTAELNGVCSLRTYENGNVKTTAYNSLTMNTSDNIYGMNSNAMEIKEKPNHINNNDNNNNNNEDDDGGTEIAIVLDGSGSIEEDDFQKAKDFIFYLMTKIWEKCNECEFAIVQYGEIIQTEFNIKDSRREGHYILDRVRRIQQVGKVTKTASALLHVLDNIFNKNYGSQESATKIILVLTDGEIFEDPVNVSTVINDPRMKSIERFSIGVGEAFNRTKAYSELKMIASDEKDHVIRVDNYSRLDGLISALQQRIIGIEGTKGDSLEYDLAQIGFAAHLQDKDTVVLGAVGAFDWSGGLMIYNTGTERQTVTFLNESSDAGRKTARNSYLGYSVTTAKGRHTFLYMAGAPRHSNVGRVLVFEKDVTSYHLSQTLEGEQLGSYFGHELCALDVESDGIVDFLLVGAPFYHVNGEEGRVYVYKLNDEGKLTLVLNLNQPDYSYARFGYSIAKIGDINQDGYQDIAIGAPLEGYLEKSDSFGSVYIYNSNADNIRALPSQIIKATSFKQKLQYFGQSVDGSLDLTEDGYPDLAVGSMGNVMVLRSRPVVKASVSLKFKPEKIPLAYTDETLQATLCFYITPFNKQEFLKTYLFYDLDLDVFMEAKRIALKKETKGKLYLLNNNCTEPIQLTVLPCRYDCFSDIVIKVSYSLKATDNNRDLPSPILDFYSPNYTFVKLPYEKDCSHKTECIPELHLATYVSRQELIVGYTKDLTMAVSLENIGDDSYMTNVTFIYPSNLQFNAIKPANNPNVKCYERKILHSYNSTMNCTIQHPVFKAREAFHIIWQLSEERFSGAEAIIYSNVSNLNGFSGLLLQKTILPVKHSISTALTVQPSIIYVKIPPEPRVTEEIQYTFKVSGENPFDAKLGLELQIPIAVESNTFFEISPIQKTQCTRSTQACKAGSVSWPHIENFLTCLVIQCNISSQQEEVQVAAKVFLQILQKIAEDTQELNITAELLYDKELYVNVREPEHQTQVSIIVLKDKVINVLPVIIGSSAGGLVLLLLIVVILLKCGFFNRKYKQPNDNGGVIDG